MVSLHEEEPNGRLKEQWGTVTAHSSELQKEHLTGHFVAVAQNYGFTMFRSASKLANVVRKWGRQWSSEMKFRVFMIEKIYAATWKN